MKKLLLLLTLLPSILFAQLNVDNQWRNSINPIFNNLEKNRIDSGILLDYAMEFTDIPSYNGVLNENNYVDLNVYGNIYKTLFMGKVVADTTNTPVYNRFAYNLAREVYQENKDTPNHIILTGLAYEYQKLDSTALANNKIIVNDNRYDDKYSNGVWQNPYLTDIAVAFTPHTLKAIVKPYKFNYQLSHGCPTLKIRLVA
ncbi:hypothetical protein FNJ87_00955 [Nonlabens mediterrranea]|uniref:Uncharacterized protein n=1 Tax=Nonlabens mediterrranea TaxID=1419947 RepID=A0ABS0A0R8_9FLAO|nr:hypothetical protein [Nonlabens mediterrranea]